MENGFPSELKHRGLRLDLTMPPDWERIEPLRQAIALCAAAVFDNPELPESLAMVSAELLENAIKHGQPGPIFFSLREENHSVLVTVRNSIEQQSPSLAALVARLSWIESFPEPGEAYLSAMSVIYEDGARVGGSELGLVRIVFEGKCQIECKTSEPGFVTVRARYPLSTATGNAP
jgi:hypothetical protein